MIEPRHRQRALVLLSLLASWWCAPIQSAEAQLLFDDRDEVVYQAQRIQREGHVQANPPARLSVPAAEPEQILESPIHEEHYDDCGGCNDVACSACRPHHGPLGFVRSRIELMKIQQQTTSWMNRPMSFGVFFGQIWGDDLIKDHVRQGDGFFGGYALGNDLNINWGWEARLGLSSLDIEDDQIPVVHRTGDIILCDLNVHYYPWANARWRPYGSFGFGLAYFDFDDELGQSIEKATFALPVGVGMKYLIGRNSALRFELKDNIAFSTGRLDTQHNFSLTAGLELRFGGVQRSYWPWNPGQDYGYW